MSLAGSICQLHYSVLPVAKDIYNGSLFLLGNINHSLMVLRNCIEALRENQQGMSQKVSYFKGIGYYFSERFWFKMLTLSLSF